MGFDFRGHMILPRQVATNQKYNRASCCIGTEPIPGPTFFWSIYIYIFICVCVCVCVFMSTPGLLKTKPGLLIIWGGY
jgi:hypothetical protein